MKIRFLLAALAAALIVIGDLITKNMIVARLEYGDMIPITSYFNIARVHNTGAAFGLFAGANEALRVPFFIFVSVTAFIVISVLLAKATDERRWYALGLGLVLGGAVGNFIDRIRYGYVVDFLDVHIGASHWPAFNVADAAISVGVGLLLIDMIQMERQEKKAKVAESA